MDSRAAEAIKLIWDDVQRGVYFISGYIPSKSESEWMAREARWPDETTALAWCSSRVTALLL